MQQAQQGKLVGEPPTIYNGDRKKTTLFINEWELYWAVNNDNALMINPYRRAMFFLTYIKGARVNEWVMVVNRWLAQQIQGGINNADKRLWNEVAASFTRRFADSLAKENAQSILRARVKMKGEDIDTYIVEIEELIRLAEYRFDVPQTIETFTDGLPTGLYQKVLELDRPITYDQWKQAAINHQQDYIHMKARLKAHVVSYVRDEELYHLCCPPHLYVKGDVMRDTSGLVCHIVYIPYFSWSLQGFLP